MVGRKGGGISKTENLRTELFGASLAGDFLDKFNVLGVADCDGLNSEHPGDGVWDAGVHVGGGVGEYFFSKVDVVVGEIPDVAAVDAGEVDA